MDFGIVGGSALVGFLLTKIGEGIYGSVAAAPRIGTDPAMRAALQEQWDERAYFDVHPMIGETSREQSIGRAIQVYPLNSGDARETLTALVFRHAFFLKPGGVFFVATRHSGNEQQHRWYMTELPDLVARERQAKEAAARRSEVRPTDDRLSLPDNRDAARRRLGILLSPAKPGQRKAS
jgi:hypothetical protein